jgi:hypothetical protein
MASEKHDEFTDPRTPVAHACAVVLVTSGNVLSCTFQMASAVWYRFLFLFSNLHNRDSADEA